MYPCSPHDSHVLKLIFVLIREKGKRQAILNRNTFFLNKKCSLCYTEIHLFPFQWIKHHLMYCVTIHQLIMKIWMCSIMSLIRMLMSHWVLMQGIWIKSGLTARLWLDLLRLSINLIYCHLDYCSSYLSRSGQCWLAYTLGPSLSSKSYPGHMDISDQWKLEGQPVVIPFIAFCHK